MTDDKAHRGRSDGGAIMPTDSTILAAAYDVLTHAGNTYGWEEYVEKAHHDLGLLIARIVAHGSIYPTGHPAAGKDLG